MGRKIRKPMGAVLNVIKELGKLRSGDGLLDADLLFGEPMRKPNLIPADKIAWEQVTRDSGSNR